MYYGQWETDKVIEKYFPGQNKGVCIEVGAYDGIKGSNTKYFEDLGWYAICIEPNPYIITSLHNNRKGPCIETACSEYMGHGELEVYNFKSGIQSSLTSLETDPRLIRDYGDAVVNTVKCKVNTTNLKAICDMFELNNIDFISIDTEGTELDVLKGLKLVTYRPKLLVVENNYADNNVYEYLEGRGYTFSERYYVNDFFTRNNI